MTTSKRQRAAILSLSPEQRNFATGQTSPGVAAVPPAAPAKPATPTASSAGEAATEVEESKELLEASLIGKKRRYSTLASGAKKARLTGYVSQQVDQKLQAYLEAEDRTLSYVLERALPEWLERHGI